MTTLSTLSTLQKSYAMREAVARTDKALQKAQQELTTGLHQDVYEATGFRAAQSLDLRNRMDRIEAFSTSNSLLAGTMSVINSQLAAMRTSVQEFIAKALPLTGGGNGAEAVALEARALIANLTAGINTPYGGTFLFSGMDTGALPLSDTGRLSSLSALPDGAGDAEVAAEIARINGFFDLDGATAPAGTGFAAEHYRGSQAGDMSAQIDEYSGLNFGMRADHEAFRMIFKGLAMFSDPSYAGSPASEAWISEAITALSDGVDGLQREEAMIGNQQGLVEDASARQANLRTIYNNRIVDIEGVDSYEAATRTEQLTAQLQASYQVTVRMQRLSLLNYL